MEANDECPTLPLAGLKLLVVEDDYLAAEDLATTLRELGAVVLGPAPNAGSALSLTSVLRPDCVLLDVNLDGKYAYGLAQELAVRGVHTVFTTGYHPSVLPSHLQGIACVQKPLETKALVRSILSPARGPDREALAFPSSTSELFPGRALS